MNLKSTPNNVTKLEKIFDEAKYILRYEKGTFNSGFCVLEHKKVVVINKFLNIEGRINTLIDIIPSIAVEEGFLTPESQKLYRQIMDERAVEDAAEAKIAAEAAETEGAAENTSEEASASEENTGEESSEEETSSIEATASQENTSSEEENTPSTEDTSSEETPSTPKSEE